MTEYMQRFPLIAAELRRLSSCADIPLLRRRALLRLADEIDPLPIHAAAHQADTLMFADPYFRRAGLRLRSFRTPDAIGPRPLLAIAGGNSNE